MKTKPAPSEMKRISAKDLDVIQSAQNSYSSLILELGQAQRQIEAIEKSKRQLLARIAKHENDVSVFMRESILRAGVDHEGGKWHCDLTTGEIKRVEG